MFSACYLVWPLRRCTKRTSVWRLHGCLVIGAYTTPYYFAWVSGFQGATGALHRPEAHAAGMLGLVLVGECNAEAGGVLAANAMIYFAPFHTPQVLCIDPDTQRCCGRRLPIFALVLGIEREEWMTALVPDMAQTLRFRSWSTSAPAVSANPLLAQVVGGQIFLIVCWLIWTAVERLGEAKNPGPKAAKDMIITEGKEHRRDAWTSAGRWEQQRG